MQLYGILRCIDINEFTIDRRREEEKKRRIRSIMINETIISVNKRDWLCYYEPYIKKYILMDISKDRDSVNLTLSPSIPYMLH